jgi:hypothetical protein
MPPIVLGTSLRRLRPELGKTYPRSFNPTQLDFRLDDIASILAWIVKKLARCSNACAAGALMFHGASPRYSAAGSGSADHRTLHAY